MSNFIRLEENLIDFSIAATPANVLLELSKLLETNDFQNQKIGLVLGDILFTPEHILSLKSVLDHSGVKLDVIYTKSLNTQLAALSAGLIVAEQPDFSGKNQEDTEDAVENNINIENETINTTETINTEASEQYETEKALEEIFNQEEQEQPASKTKDYRTQTLYLKQTLRSGQTVNYDGNIVVIGDCHPGSEIVASGDITVWGILSGIAHAGSNGNTEASIRALKINAIQLRIADLYARKPDRLEFEKVERISSFTPEEAKISHGEIKIYTLNG